MVKANGRMIDHLISSWCFHAQTSQPKTLNSTPDALQPVKLITLREQSMSAILLLCFTW